MRKTTVEAPSRPPRVPHVARGLFLTVENRCVFYCRARRRGHLQAAVVLSPKIRDQAAIRFHLWVSGCQLERAVLHESGSGRGWEEQKGLVGCSALFAGVGLCAWLAGCKDTPG